MVDVIIININNNPITSVEFISIEKQASFVNVFKFTLILELLILP